MKRLLIFLLSTLTVFAAGSVQQSTQQLSVSPTVYVVTFQWTGDASNGTVPITAAQGLASMQGYRVVSVETVPTSPSPTNGYNVALVDSFGVDTLNGIASGLSSSAPQSFSGSPTASPIFGTFSLKVTGQSVASAQGQVLVYISPITQVLGLTPSAPSFPSQGADLLYGSPCGSSGSPGFRALCNSDFSAVTLPIASGGTGATTQSGALANILGGSQLPIASGGTGAGTSSGGLANLLSGNAQGTYTNKVMMSGTNSGTTGAPLCNDASGNATTSGCTPPLPSGTQTQQLQIQPNTGNNITYQWSNKPVFNAADYNFPAQAPGGSLAAGSVTITLSPCPLGVNGADTNHYLYISGGTGTAEPVLITGGTCSAATTSGTVVVTTGYTHSGAWTVQSKDGGVQEAVQAASTAGGGLVFVPAGTYTLRAAVQVPSSVILQGSGQGSTVLQVGGGSLARTPPWQNGGAPSGYYCEVCLVSGSSYSQVRDLTVDENGTYQTYVYISGDIEGYDVTNSVFNNVTVKNRMLGGTGVGMSFYNGTTAQTLNKNNVIEKATVLGLPSCTVPNGGGAYYIEGYNNRIINSYAYNICDTAFVVAGCTHCSVIGSTADVGTGQLSTPMFTVSSGGATQPGADDLIADSHCTATGTNTAGSCFEADNGANNTVSGVTFANDIADHCGYGFEINNGTFASHLSTDITFSNITANGCSIGVNLGHGNADKVTISGAHIYGSSYAGISLYSPLSTAVLNHLTITGSVLDHNSSFGILAQTVLSDLIKNLTITNNFIGDTQSTPVEQYGIYLDTGAITNAVIRDNILIGATTQAIHFGSTFTGAIFGPNIDGSSDTLMSSQSTGAAVTAASTITPTGLVFHVTGTAAISTINTSAVTNPGGMVGCVTLIPDGAWTTGTGGNIAIASTAVVGKQMSMCYDSGTSKWYSSY